MLKITHCKKIVPQLFEQTYGKMQADNIRVKPDGSYKKKRSQSVNVIDMDNELPTEMSRREVNAANVKHRKQQFLEFLSKKSPRSRKALAQWLFRTTSVKFDSRNRTPKKSLTAIALLNNLTQAECLQGLMVKPIKYFLRDMRESIRHHKPSLLVTGTHGSGGVTNKPWLLGSYTYKNCIIVTDLFKRQKLAPYRNKPVLIEACTDFASVSSNPLTYIPARVSRKNVAIGMPLEYLVDGNTMNTLISPRYRYPAERYLPIIANMSTGMSYRDYIKNHYDITLPDQPGKWTRLPK